MVNGGTLKGLCYLPKVAIPMCSLRALPLQEALGYPYPSVLSVLSVFSVLCVLSVLSDFSPRPFLGGRPRSLPCDRLLIVLFPLVSSVGRYV